MGGQWTAHLQALSASGTVSFLVLGGQKKPPWAFVCVCLCLFWAHLQNQCITSVPTVRLYLDSLGPVPIITGT